MRAVTFTPVVRLPNNWQQPATDLKLEQLRRLYRRKASGYLLTQQEIDAAAAELQAALVAEFEMPDHVESRA